MILWRTSHDDRLSDAVRSLYLANATVNTLSGRKLDPHFSLVTICV